MPISFTPDQIHAEAIRLGLINAGQQLPQNLRSTVVASLATASRLAVEMPPTAPRPASTVEIHTGPDGFVTIDGRPFPWLIAPEQIAVTLNPDGSGTVRLAIEAGAVTINSTPKDNRA
jgi:hypothetical protein